MRLLMALETMMSDLENTVQDGESGPSEDRHRTEPLGRPVASTIILQHIQTAAVFIAPRGCAPVCSTSVVCNRAAEDGAGRWLQGDDWPSTCRAEVVPRPTARAVVFRDGTGATDRFGSKMFGYDRRYRRDLGSQPDRAVN
jgi:hypothetical protein